MESGIRKISLPIYKDERGNLLPLEHSLDNLPFEMVRSFILFDIPQGQKRAGHAVNSELFIVAVKGRVTVINTKGDNSQSQWTLDDSSFGLYIPPFSYLELVDFTAESVIVICASKKFKATKYFSLDYILNNGK